MQKALFPGYSVGPDAYEDIANICPAYGKTAAIIGGRKALAAAEPQIRKAVEGSGEFEENERKGIRLWIYQGLKMHLFE